MFIRPLCDDDKPLLVKFLREHIDTSMFMLSNLERASVTYRNQPHHGIYLGAFDKDGQLCGILVQYWNKMMMMQAPDLYVLNLLLAACVDHFDQPVASFLGDDRQILHAIAHFKLSDDTFAINRPEERFGLELEQLKPLPERANLQLAHASKMDQVLLYQWVRAYNIEALGQTDNAALDEKVRVDMDNRLNRPHYWCMFDGDIPVSLCGFNANLPDIVQIGPVWTPPEHRSKGYARYIVEKALQVAREEGVQRAILFTDHPAATKAYVALGFEHAGAFRLAFLNTPQQLFS